MTPSTEPAVVMLLCPNLKCKKVLRVPESCRGKAVSCQFCKITFQVPHAKKIEAPTPPPAAS